VLLVLNPSLLNEWRRVVMFICPHAFPFCLCVFKFVPLCTIFRNDVTDFCWLLFNKPSVHMRSKCPAVALWHEGSVLIVVAVFVFSN